MWKKDKPKKVKPGQEGACCLLPTADRSDKRENDIIANNLSPACRLRRGRHMVFAVVSHRRSCLSVNLHVGVMS